jgi:hypothetical protein
MIVASARYHHTCEMYEFRMPWHPNLVGKGGDDLELRPNPTQHIPYVHVVVSASLGTGHFLLYFPINGKVTNICHVE